MSWQCLLWGWWSISQRKCSQYGWTSWCVMVWKEHSSPLAWRNVGVLSSTEPLSDLAKWWLLFFPDILLKANIYIQSFQGIAERKQCIQFRQEKKELSRSTAAMPVPLTQRWLSSRALPAPCIPHTLSLCNRWLSARAIPTGKHFSPHPPKFLHDFMGRGFLTRNFQLISRCCFPSHIFPPGLISRQTSGTGTEFQMLFLFCFGFEITRKTVLKQDFNVNLSINLCVRRCS